MGENEVRKILEVYNQCDAFFKEALDKAVQNQNVQISDAVASYLLWLLLQGLRKDPHFDAETTIKRYLNAFTGKGPESFRDIGDSSLMLAGIWPDSLYRQAISMDYYIQMGRLAYRKEAETNRAFNDLFEELSENFLKSVNILVEATQFISQREPTPDDIMKIYEKWLKTHSDFLERILVKFGINPVFLKSDKQ